MSELARARKLALAAAPERLAGIARAVYRKRSRARLRGLTAAHGSSRSMMSWMRLSASRHSVSIVGTLARSAPDPGAPSTNSST